MEKMITSLEKPKLKNVDIILSFICLRGNEFIFQKSLKHPKVLVQVAMLEYKEYKVTQQRGSTEAGFL